MFYNLGLPGKYFEIWGRQANVFQNLGLPGKCVLKFGVARQMSFEIWSRQASMFQNLGSQSKNGEEALGSNSSF